MIRGIIFDVDNTLLDFLRMKKASIAEAIEAMIDAGLEIDRDKAFKIIHEVFQEQGMEAHTLFQGFSQKVLGKVDYKVVASAVVSHKRVWNSLLHTYPGVVRTLLKLKQSGIKLCIVSDADRLHCYERLCGMHIADFFDVIVSHEDTHQYKPARRPFYHALKMAKIKPHECLMVGDWIKGDIIGAKKMGMITCLAKYGAVTKETRVLCDSAHLKKYKTKSDFVLNQFDDIFKVVQKINNPQ